VGPVILSPEARLTPSIQARDVGYFPAGRSMLRRVHGERVVGLHYGQRTALVGALDALLYEGTQRHTRDKARPWARLRRTGRIMETIFFGTRAEADRELARVASLHQHVQGRIERPLGEHRAGTTYSAYDPALAFRTLGSVADSAQTIYEAFVRPLTDPEREALWRDYLLLGELFGLARDDAPASHAEFRVVWDRWLVGDSLHLTDAARESALQTAFEQPLPHGVSALQRRINYLVIAGTIPGRIRDIYDLPWGPPQRAAFGALVRAARTGRHFAPRVLRRGQNAIVFDLVARTEQQRLERSERTWRVA
jgi:uncharacterized protein (DUF2236 family)